MLIAIMGNTFTIGNETEEQTKYREHLRFVVDNWFLRELSFKNIDSVKYIVTAFSAGDQEEENEVFAEIKNEIMSQHESLSNTIKMQGDQIKDMKRMMIQLIKLNENIGEEPHEKGTLVGLNEASLDPNVHAIGEKRHAPVR